MEKSAISADFGVCLGYTSWVVRKVICLTASPTSISLGLTMSDTTVDEILERGRSGERRSIAKILSAIQEGTQQGQGWFEMLLRTSSDVHIIGVTGPVGAGKSTLVDRLAASYVQAGFRVGIIAIDPSSPFSGGAVLGDRIRMASIAGDPQVFIRSLAARGNLGGLAPRAKELALALGGLGYDLVLLETVGVGQNEVEVLEMADTIVVTLVPGMGDAIQTLKAGVLEIADVFALNKADFHGVAQLERELLSMLRLAEDVEWSPPIIQTVATGGAGISELFEACEAHKLWLSKAQQRRTRRLTLLRSLLQDELNAAWETRILDSESAQDWLADAVAALERHSTSPKALAAEFIDEILPAIVTGPTTVSEE